MLDNELNKVEAFYAEREKEMCEHDKLLRKQLKELGVHREVFYVGVLYRMHVPLTIIPLEIIRAVEDSKLDQEDLSFCLACTFVTDQAVLTPQLEAKERSSNKQEE